MFEKSIPLFKLFGFEVRLDPSWLILGMLITWTLAQGVFPSYYRGLPVGTYWWMGFFGAVGIFLSIVFHELCHSLVARRFGLPMKGITLFIFGGVAEMDEEPPSAKAEFFMAIAGPLASMVLGFIFLASAASINTNPSTVPVLAVIKYLGLVNLILAGFNILPAFPLDGGRVLRSALWKWNGNLNKSTKISSQAGSVFGLALSFFGLLQMFAGAFIGGLWMLLIGLFLRNAAQLSYQQLLMRQTLKGERVGKFMKRNPVTVIASLSLKDFVEDYVYKYHYKMFPVVNDGKVLGCVTTREVKDIPSHEWDSRQIKDIMKNCSTANTVTPNTEAIKALSIMSKANSSRLMVVNGEDLEGIITLKDLLSFFALKLDLEGDQSVGDPFRTE